MFRSRALEKENYVFGLSKTVYPQKNSYIYILSVMALCNLVGGFSVMTLMTTI
jgi:hypothetical protein